MEAIEQLQQLGFSQYEAKAYITLLSENPLNGYELAKASGIPRPNIYAVLQKLEDSGAILRMSEKDGTRYVPVPAEELLAKLKRRYQENIEAASSSLQTISSPPQVEAILNFTGYDGLLEQAQALIERTKNHLLVSLWPEEALALAGPIQQRHDQGVEVTTLCLRGCPQPCPACRGAVYRYALIPESGKRWLVLVSDETELLAGEIQSPAEGSTPAVPGSAASAVRTRQPMLVNLTGGYIQNSIALASILTGLGDRLFEELDPQVLTALNNLRPFHTRGGWLEVMRRQLRLENDAK